MARYFNREEITVRRVENGFVCTGKFNWESQELIAETLADVFEILWLSYTEHRVGERMPAAIREALNAKDK